MFPPLIRFTKVFSKMLDHGLYFAQKVEVWHINEQMLIVAEVLNTAKIVDL